MNNSVTIVENMAFLSGHNKPHQFSLGSEGNSRQVPAAWPFHEHWFQLRIIKERDHRMVRMIIMMT